MLLKKYSPARPTYVNAGLNLTILAILYKAVKYSLELEEHLEVEYGKCLWHTDQVAV
jgi:hypothetical protein